jgi:hypothetical protein
MVMKAAQSSDHLALEDTTSDLTMSGRYFYGTGQMFMTPIKIPAFSDDHDFRFPLTAASFPTGQHRDAHRYTKKPSEKELLIMVETICPKRVNEKTMILKNGRTRFSKLIFLS